MKPPRVVLVSRRFWPMAGGPETMLARLGSAWQARGLATTVLTARWQADWPAEFDHHGIRVVRIGAPQPGWRAHLRYLRTLAAWIRTHRSEFDLVYVSGLREDAYAVIGAARRDRFPVVLRAERAGLDGDCYWQLEAPSCGARIKRRCRQADALVAPTPPIERELIAAGYPRERIEPIGLGVQAPPPASALAQSDARAALALAQPQLTLPPRATLAVFAGALDERKGVRDLIAAWQRVAVDRPEARLWLVGEGTQQAQLAADIHNAHLYGKVVLAGTFDDVEDCLRAADLFVLPAREENTSLALIEAMAWGLPIVATATVGHQLVIENRQQGLLVPRADPQALAAAIEELCGDPALAARLGQAAQERAQRDFPLDTAVDRHVALFEKLAW